MSRLSTTMLVTAILCGWSLESSLFGQRPLITGGEAPGMAAHKRLIAEPELAGYEQPVRIVLSFGGQVAFFTGSGFSPIIGHQTLLGLQVGPVYRLQVTGVIAGVAHEVYPTIEMVDRTYPPEILRLRHPVKIVLSRSDIEDASAGILVTKVIYVENPDTALPYRQTYDHQATLDVGSGQDPYQVAERLGRPIAIVRVGSRRPLESDSEFSNVHYHFPVRLFSAPAGPVETDLALQNIPEAGVYDPHAAACIPCSAVDQIPKRYRDEYICDGNDRGVPARSDKDFNVQGIDLEDTVGHFDTLGGRFVISPSNRVCIYAPRFSAVRRALQANSEIIRQKLGSADENLQIAHTRHSDFSSTSLQNIQLQSNRKAERVNSIRERTRGVLVEKTVKLLGSRQALKPYENLSLVRFGEHVNSESARLGLAIQSAISWGGDVRAQITVNKQQPIVVNDVTKASEFIGVETKSVATLQAGFDN